MVEFKGLLDRHVDIQGLVGYGSCAGNEISISGTDIVDRRVCSYAVLFYILQK